MVELFEHLTLWHWFGLALVLLITEAVAFNGYLLWVGLSALIVAVLMLLFDIGWQAQLLVFAVCSMAFTLLWYRHWIKRPVKTEAPLLNQRASQFVGRTVTVVKAIRNNQGKVKIDDSLWRVAGPDADEGQQVRVIEVVDDLTLKVELLP
jgi:membrane protein implicated in regulation of membrane protease activity